MKKVLCKREHRMIVIVPGLLLCECSSYGPLTSLLGAVAEARLLAEKSGGIAMLRDRIESEERQVATRRKGQQEEGLRVIRNKIRVDTV